MIAYHSLIYIKYIWSSRSSTRNQNLVIHKLVTANCQTTPSTRCSPLITKVWRFVSWIQLESFDSPQILMKLRPFKSLLSLSRAFRLDQLIKLKSIFCCEKTGLNPNQYGTWFYWSRNHSKNHIIWFICLCIRWFRVVQKQSRRLDSRPFTIITLPDSLSSHFDDLMGFESNPLICLTWPIANATNLRSNLF